jgi:sporulation related protein
MNYDFTLDRKGMFSVLASTVLLGAILFVAGLIVGSYWTANEPTASASARKTNAANQENALPQEPVIQYNVPQTNVIVPNKPATGLNAGTVGPAGLTATQGLPQGPPPPSGPAQPAAAATDQGADNKANAPAADGAGQQATKPEDSATQAQTTSQTDLVTVEVGTFLDANAANGLFKSLERKGYAPAFFTGRDAQAREWYSIRIGAYSDKQQAENAAANFAKQEKMKVKVRPLGSL